MLCWLVTNDNEESLLMPYVEKYQLFKDPGRALAHAVRIGFANPFGSKIAISDQPGMQQIYQAGEVKVTILCLELKG